jgi:hypothetical protein
MSELSNQASEQKEFKASFSIPGGGVSVAMAVPVAERMKQHVMDAFRELPRRGLEVGGVLLGRIVQRDPFEVVVENFEPLPCEHRFGPSFILSEADQAELEKVLSRVQQQPGSTVVGYYRSFTGREIELDEMDRELIDRYFSNPEHVVLAIRPVSITQCVAWCFTGFTRHLPPDPAAWPPPIADESNGSKRQQDTPVTEEAREGSMTSHPDSTERVPDPPVFIHRPLPPLPPRDPEPQPAARRPGVWALAAVAAVAGLALFYPRLQEPATQESLPIELNAQRTANGIEVSWSRSVAAQNKEISGVLAIHEGSSERDFKLDAATLQRGHVVYKTSGNDLLLRLSIFTPGKPPLVESFRMESAAEHSSQADPPQVAGTGGVAPVTPLEPRPSVAKAAPASPSVAESHSRRAVPDAAVPAETLHEVRPGISDSIQGRLTAKVIVPIDVQIDTAGKVTAAKSRETGDEVYGYLAARASAAARFWRFRPARDKKGNSVPSTKTLYFVFPN